MNYEGGFKMRCQCVVGPPDNPIPMGTHKDTLPAAGDEIQCDEHGWTEIERSWRRSK